MTRPLNSTDQYVDASHYGDLYTVYERQDGTVYKICVSRYTGDKTIIEYANRQAYYAWRRADDIVLDPEGKGHKGAVGKGSDLPIEEFRPLSLFSRTLKTP